MLSLHLDTDLGGDIDDLCALALLLNWPDINPLGITTVAEHQGKRAGYVHYALRLAGRTEIPVAAGADVSLNVYRSWPALPRETRYWPEPIPPALPSLETALSLLEHSIEQGAIVVAIGPFTNLALLEKRCPGILLRARLYVMGGYLYRPRSGFPAWNHEMDYNVQVDVDSALHVFQHSNPTLVPIAVTIETSLRRAHLGALRHSGPLARLIARQAEAFAEDERMEERYGKTYDGVSHDIINFQHDPLTCAIALGWGEGVKIEEVSVKSQIQYGFLRQRAEAGGQRMKIVTEVNGSAFNDFWLRTVTGANADELIRGD